MKIKHNNLTSFPNGFSYTMKRYTFCVLLVNEDTFQIQYFPNNTGNISVENRVPIVPKQISVQFDIDSNDKL